MDDASKKRLKAKVMMQAMLLGLQEIAKEDPTIQGQLRGWDRVIQYTVLPDGPHMHLVVRDGGVSAIHGPHEKPAATIKFADVDTALAVFTRKIDAQAAFMQGKVQLAGDMADAMKVSLVTQMATQYFQ
jgi:putative sterol carrier protein